MTGRDAQDEDEKYEEDDYDDDLDDGLVMDDAGGKTMFSFCGEYLKPVII